MCEFIIQNYHPTTITFITMVGKLLQNFTMYVFLYHFWVLFWCFWGLGVDIDLCDCFLEIIYRRDLSPARHCSYCAADWRVRISARVYAAF